MIMISRQQRTAFRVLKKIEGITDEGGSRLTRFVPQETLYGVLTNVSTSDTQLSNSDVLSRQRRLRVFTPIDVNYNDKVEIEGQVWYVIGQPQTTHSTSNRRKLSTVIILGKEGLK